MGRIDDLQNPRYHLIKCICGWTLIIIFLPPSIWLTLIVLDQKEIQCSIEDFYIASDPTNQSVIYFDLKLQNEAKDNGVYYDALNLTFSYYVDPNPSRGTIIRVANYTIHGFHPGQDKQTHLNDFVLTPALSWEAVSNNGSLSKAVFRVDLASKVRFEDFAWKGKRRKLIAWADVEVDGITGKKVKTKGNTLAFSPYPCWCFLLLRWYLP